MSRRFSPDPWERFPAIRTISIRLHAVLLHEEAEPLDDRRVAVVTTRVFPLADLARQIAGIEVFQAGLLAELDDLHEIFDGRLTVAVGHLVVRVERRHVPGHERV